MAQMVKSLPAMWETQVRSLGQEDPWRRKWQSTPEFLPGKSHGQRSVAGYSPDRQESRQALCLQRVRHNCSLSPTTGVKEKGTKMEKERKCKAIPELDTILK